MRSETRRMCLRQLTKIVIIIFVLLISVSIGASESDPYTIYGTVKDENGMAGVGATITVENLNTNEKSSNGNDTVTGSPIPITINSNGIYTFELKNFKNSYRIGDEIKVTAEKDGIIVSESTFVSAGGWGEEVDITLVNEKTQEKESRFIGISNIWLLHLIFFMIIGVIITILLLRRKKGEKPKSERFQSNAEGYDNRNYETNMKPDKQSVPDNGLVAYECPECDNEINLGDTICPGCGAMFAEIDERPSI